MNDTILMLGTLLLALSIESIAYTYSKQGDKEVAILLRFIAVGLIVSVALVLS